MNRFKIIILLCLVFNILFAKEQQPKILVNYKYNNLEYVKELDDKVIDGEYNAIILYSAKMVKKDIKYEEKGLFKKDKLILKPDESKKFSINFIEPLDIGQYPNFEFIYKSLNPLIKSQNFAQYELILSKNNNLSKVKFTNLDLDLDLDLDKATYALKDKMYVIKRMFKLGFNNTWMVNHKFPENDLIQRRFDKLVTYNDTIEIWTKKDVELDHIVFVENGSIILPLSFLDTRSNDKYNIYSLDINKLLNIHFEGKKEVQLNELMLYIDGKFKTGDIKKLRFLHSNVDKKKGTKNYKIEKVINNIYRHKIDLKDYQDYKIKAIDIKIVNNSKNKLILKEIKLNLFSNMKVNIPIVLDKYFSSEVKTKTYNELKNINFNTTTKINRIKKIINFNKSLNLPDGFICEIQDNKLALIKIGNINMDINISIPFNFNDKKIRNLSFNDKNDKEYISYQHNKISINIPKEYFIFNNSFLISDFTIEYIDYNLSLNEILKDDLNEVTNLFGQIKRTFNIDINNSKYSLNTKDPKYFNIDSITLIPNFTISKEKFLKLIEKDQDITTVEATSKIWKILKLGFYIVIIWILFKIRRFIWFIIIGTILKVKNLIELIVDSSLKNSILYFIISLILYGKFIISSGVNTNSIYVSFAGIVFVIALSYLSLYLRPWILTKYTGIGRKIYRGSGSIYFVWAILFLILTAIFVSIKLEPIAEQFAIIVYYLLVWGTIKELINLKKSE